ncbi:MAG: DUF4381 domain-containing protein [Gammaproteobacteria bacterium]|nr:DUF4381 domain-containing protein [Gammaproteobacteria bacterium]MDD9958227.1 DUF4381 domain-containing protein [Gammaproteobacteria bacterium]
MDSEELLAQLADIHLPGEISYWPPAPGWWVLAALLLLGGYFLIRKIVQQRNLQKVCQHALAELENCYLRFASAEEEDMGGLRLRYVNEFNSVMRRVALVHFPQANVASLGGDAWVDFIRQKGDSSGLNDEIAAALSFGRFQTQCDVDVDAMNSLGQAWITSLYLNSKKFSQREDGVTDA